MAPTFPTFLWTSIAWFCGFFSFLFFLWTPTFVFVFFFVDIHNLVCGSPVWFADIHAILCPSAIRNFCARFCAVFLDIHSGSRKSGLCSKQYIMPQKIHYDPNETSLNNKYVDLPLERKRILLKSNQEVWR